MDIRLYFRAFYPYSETRYSLYLSRDEEREKKEILCAFERKRAHRQPRNKGENTY